ncbi:MAG: efflux RND transporter periplasmic adaptor subunit [Candidatus Buchananbacteria bacterium]|nr:efflux RND transporter periplasmic adaptor subunit [Candidatus Buchananbacteria bacterium]
MKILKSKLFWLALVVVIAVGGFVFVKLGSQKPTVEYQTEEVKQGLLVQTVSATGQVKSAQDIELNFKNTGRLSVLNVKTGDKVTKDQVLAQLRSTDLAINVSKARASLDEAVANLNRVKAGATTEDIAVYEAAVKKAETDYYNAQTELESTKETYSQASENERQSALVDISGALTKANISLQKVYDTLNYKGNANNFNTSNFTFHQQVQNEYTNSVSAVDEAELAYGTAKLDATPEKVNEAVQKVLAALTDTLATVSDLSSLLDDVITNSNLTQTELDALKTTINTERTTTNASLSTIQSANQDLIDASLNYQTKVQTAENNVSTTQKTLAKAEADLALRKAPARPEDVALYQAQVNRARADLQLAQERYDETIIKAPIDGVVTDVNYSIGEQTSLSEPVIMMLAAENYQIEVDIPESDIVKINVGDDANITLDAFSFEEIFNGTVTTINPAQTEIQDVIYYRVTVTFTDSQPENVAALMEKIKPGMTANIDINTDRRQDVVIAPQRAIKDDAGVKYAEILEAGVPKRVEVTLGVRGDDGLIEVISGLMPGQQVITFVRNGK